MVFGSFLDHLRVCASDMGHVKDVEVGVAARGDRSRWGEFLSLVSLSFLPWMGHITNQLFPIIIEPWGQDKGVDNFNLVSCPNSLFHDRSFPRLIPLDPLHLGWGAALRSDDALECLGDVFL